MKPKISLFTTAIFLHLYLGLSLFMVFIEQRKKKRHARKFKEEKLKKPSAIYPVTHPEVLHYYGIG